MRLDLWARGSPMNDKTNYRRNERAANCSCSAQLQIDATWLSSLKLDVAFSDFNGYLLICIAAVTFVTVAEVAASISGG